MGGKTCENQNPCPCPNKDCPRHGVCCECVKGHIARGDLPFCLHRDEE